MKYNLAVFSFGSLSQKAIIENLKLGGSVICVSDRAQESDRRNLLQYSPNIILVDRKNVVNLDISCDVALICWRDDEVLNKNQIEFNAWIKSPRFIARRFST
jgi:hypothetical protein